MQQRVAAVPRRVIGRLFPAQRRFVRCLIRAFLATLISGFSLLPVHAADSAPANSLTAGEKADGWKLLWDGKTTAGWRSPKTDAFPTHDWTIDDGVLTVHGSGGPASARGGDIITLQRFSNFELTADFKITPGANSGIKIFVQPNLAPAFKDKGKAAVSSAIGLEFQILDDVRHPDAKAGRDGDRTIGSLYDLIPAPKGKHVQPIGEWNHARILARGRHVEFWLNGAKTVEFERGSPDFRQRVAASKYRDFPEFGEWADGHILLQEHATDVSFRNVKLRELAPMTPNPAVSQKIWIDADSGNETDDIYALFQALSEPSAQVVGLSSAHFNNSDLVAFKKWNQYATAGIDTVGISQAINASFLAVMGRADVPALLGADRQMGRAWGGREPRDSAAARGIIAAVNALSENEKLIVINLGALTNVASAVSLDKSIAPKIVIYLLGAQYDATRKIWNKSEFNIRNDLNAFDYLLDQPEVDLVVMPVNVAQPFRFERDFLYGRLDSRNPAERMLKQRWQETNPDDTSRVLWDLALVAAFFHPECATLQPALTPPENTQRSVRVYTSINVPALTAEFLRQLHRQPLISGGGKSPR